MIFTVYSGACLQVFECVIIQAKSRSKLIWKLEIQTETAGKPVNEDDVGT